MGGGGWLGKSGITAKSVTLPLSSLQSNSSRLQPEVHRSPPPPLQTENSLPTSCAPKDKGHLPPWAISPLPSLGPQPDSDWSSEASCSPREDASLNCLITSLRAASFNITEALSLIAHRGVALRADIHARPWRQCQPRVGSHTAGGEQTMGVGCRGKPTFQLLHTSSAWAPSHQRAPRSF